MILLLVIGFSAGLFLLITKPGHDRREREFRDHLAAYIKGIEDRQRYHETRDYKRYLREINAGRPIRYYGKEDYEDVPADRN